MTNGESWLNEMGRRYPVRFGATIGVLALIASVVFWVLTDTKMTLGGVIVRLTSCISLAAVSAVFAKQAGQRPAESRGGKGSRDVQAQGVQLVSLVARNQRVMVQCAVLAALCLVHGLVIAGDFTVVLGSFAIGFLVMFGVMAVGTALVVKELKNAQPAPPGFEERSPSFADYRPIDRIHQMAAVVLTTYVFIQNTSTFSAVMAGMWAGFAAAFGLTASVVRSREKKRAARIGPGLIGGSTLNREALNTRPFTTPEFVIGGNRTEGSDNGRPV